MNSKPLVIAVAPNGARYSRQDHPTLPITPEQLATTAESCLKAGARMIHLHVRDDHQQHSIESKYYLPALQAVKDAVGDEMLIQVTSEAAGVYEAEQQISLMQQFTPDCMSVALREFLPQNKPVQPFSKFINKITDAGCLVQYILYDTADYNKYLNLIEAGNIPFDNHSLLFVLGRYTQSVPDVEIVEQYQHILTTDAPWMVCTFGINGHKILRKTVPLGCNIRVGFENGFTLPDGTIAKDNAELVELSYNSYKALGRPLATIEETRIALGQSSF